MARGQIRVITAQLHYLINLGGRSKELPVTVARGGRDCPTRGAIAIIVQRARARRIRRNDSKIAIAFGLFGKVRV